MSQAPLAPIKPRCEYQSNPLGLDETKPRFFWQVDDARRGAVQSAYQIRVGATPDFDGSDATAQAVNSGVPADSVTRWDSGKVASGECTHIVYCGPKLRSGQRYWWRVRTWDGQDVASPWSQTQWFEMGLLQKKDWKAQWIAAAPPPPPPAEQGAAEVGKAWVQTTPLTPEEMRCPFFRKVINLPSRPVRARLYVTARGLYEFHINGNRVGCDVFTPGWTDYRRRIAYQAYDITDLLNAGDNALGVILANGWYCGHLAWKNRTYGLQPSLLAQVHLEFADGSKQVIATDGSWKTCPPTAGPIREGDLLMGENYDARLEFPAPGWAAPRFDDATWAPVFDQPLDHVPLEASPGPRVRRHEELKTINITEPQPGGFVFDLGQNMVGVARLTVPAGTPAGTTITLRHAEVLNPDGTLYVANLRKARATDVYVCRGTTPTEPPEVFEPRFTCHGFRYVELTGFPGRPTPEAITGVVLHSDVPPTGTFECSHPLVNQLQHNIIWGQKGNFLEVPTDCPQRDERLGWMGDAQVFVRTACFNMDSAGFYTKWLLDVDDSQASTGAYPMVAPDVIDDGKGDGGPGWAEAGIIVPWNLYLCYGDRRVLERHYPAMTRYLAYLRTVDVRRRHNFADWLHHDAHTPPDLIAVAFHAHALDLMSRIAAVLGKKRDSARHAAEFRRVRGQFNKSFVTPEGRVLGDTQTAYVLALQFGLLPEGLRAKTISHLVFDIEHGRYTNTWKTRNTHQSTGFLGTRDLPFVLTAGGGGLSGGGGRLDIAYHLLLNEDYPSWLFPVKNGATTIWERWDGWTPENGFQTPGMNSFNHYAYGAIGQWLYQVVAGLDMEHADGEVGYRRLRVHPRPPADRRITSAKAGYDSIHGYAESSWQIDGGRFVLDVTVPANTSATLVLPTAAVDGVTEGGGPLGQAVGVSGVSVENGCVTCRVAAGKYRFEV